ESAAPAGAIGAGDGGDRGGRGRHHERGPRGGAGRGDGLAGRRADERGHVPGALPGGDPRHPGRLQPAPLRRRRGRRGGATMGL
ncbi:MAG: hypothetical protein AVDCRST_MAG88-1233, partial [uncultured Thermomicrobiales bacterium]